MLFRSEMSGCRKRRCLVERDVFKVGFRMGVSFERRVELSEAEMGGRKLFRQK